MEKAPLLIVEDEPGIAESLRFLLEREPFQVEHVATLSEARARLGRPPPPALVILDLGLPDGNGVELLREARANGSALPVIVLTSRGDEVDRIVGLELGADDYVAKPFSPREVVARVKAVLRRAASSVAGRQQQQVPPQPTTHQEATQQHSTQQHSTQNSPPRPQPQAQLEVDPARRRVTFRGAHVPLSRLEFDLLALLATKPGHVFTREVLLDQLWPDATVSDRTVDVHVMSVRHKLRDAGCDDELIETVRGVGYCFRE